jgi:hypothetical protein
VPFLAASGLAWFAIDSKGQKYHHSISGEDAS